MKNSKWFKILNIEFEQKIINKNQSGVKPKI